MNRIINKRLISSFPELTNVLYNSWPVITGIVTTGGAGVYGFYDLKYKVNKIEVKLELVDNEIKSIKNDIHHLDTKFDNKFDNMNSNLIAILSNIGLNKK